MQIAATNDPSSRASRENQAHLVPGLNRIPPQTKHVHLMGICGTGMASLAGMLQTLGFQVTGSDQQVYPPMSTFLEGLGISVLQGYQPSNLLPRPDLVIVGNVITRANPEAQELARLQIPYLSFPQAIRHFAIGQKKSIVVSGTHGKTTTSSLAAWILACAGLDPGFMIGGIPNNFGRNYQFGGGTFFVVEGDEYDTAFFDKGPKFLHYQPWCVLLTSIEFDHADIYRDLGHVIESFRKLIELIPPDGLLIANGDDPVIEREVRKARCPVEWYGLSEKNPWRAIPRGFHENLTRVCITRAGKEWVALETPLFGRHNLSNLLGPVILACHLGIPVPAVERALRTFTGVRRRQELTGVCNGIRILDDFAHHPTAVRETLSAVRERYEGRLIAVFEPRSNSSRRNTFQDQYAASFDAADLVMIPEPPMMGKIPVEDRFSSRRLVADLQRRGVQACYLENTDLLLGRLLEEARPGDIVLIMSNGAFDNLPARLSKALEARSGSEQP